MDYTLLFVQQIIPYSILFRNEREIKYRFNQNLTTMKTIMQYIVILLTSLSCFALFSCHDENDIFSNEIGSTLEHFDGKRVSTFYLPHDSTTISNGTNSATVYLENTETLKQY